MINYKDFTKRLQTVMEYYQLTATAFAEKINVQRSTISHLLSGRNKPSLDFVLKALEQFSEVDFFWLVKGEGQFPRKKFKSLNNNSDKIVSNLSDDNQSKNIERIVIFYNDGQFEYFTPKQKRNF